MQVRLIPYSDVFVSVTLDLNEAAALMDGLEVASDHMPEEVTVTLSKLRQDLEDALKRAGTLQQKRETLNAKLQGT